MSEHSPETSYTRFIDDFEDKLKETHSYDEIMELAVGGFFEPVGIVEREFLIQHGLRKNDYVIDVGCGSGRLARPLSEYLQGRYLGIDIVPKLIAYAEKLVNRPDWRFEVAQGLTIPEEDEQADMVCFFSVFTHLRHEETYLYLQEAKRVLKPTGKVVFSFLEFPNPYNWDVFRHSFTNITRDEPLNQFMSIDAIRTWASHLELPITTINRAGKITLSGEFRLKDGNIYKGTVLLGQSVCVLSKLKPPRWRQKLNDHLFKVADRLQQIS